MNEKILVVDDEQEIGELVGLYLKNEGYTVFSCTLGAEALACVEREELSLAILDVMLPDMTGFDLCRRIRETHMFPIVMLTAKVEDMDKITGLTLGADDYMTKPFSMPVLLEKIRVILRRRGSADEENRLRYRDLSLDLDSREALLEERPLDLTAREFELLHTFLSAPGRVFTREMLLAKLWGYDFYGDERVVDSHIKNLRHKLGRDYIETVRGVGYRAAKEDL